MVRSRTWCALALTLPGCFYADRINSRPEGKIDGPPTVHEGQEVTYDAGASRDPDGDPLSFSWTVVSCPTPNSCRPVPDLRTGDGGESLIFTVPANRDPLTIQLRTTDDAGALDLETRDVVVENLAPEITELQVLTTPNGSGGYTVGRTLRIASTYVEHDPSDTGQLTYEWRASAPDSATPGAAATALIDPQSIDETGFRVEDVGAWRVQLTISDGNGSDSMEIAVVITEDEDPCLGPLSPPAGDGETAVVVERDLGPRAFQVASVLDDLDPYPYPNGTEDADLGRPRFRWFLAPPGQGLAEIPGSDLPSYTLHPETYAPGAELGLRVEVRDRWPLADPNWPSCASDEATCWSETATCLQRVTWKVRIR